MCLLGCADLVSAEVDLNGTGLLRLWLQLPPPSALSSPSSAPLRVSWTVKALAGPQAAKSWLWRLQTLKSRERTERGLRLLL